MGVQKELFSLFGNGRRDNLIFSLNAGESMTLDFRNSGTNTTTKRFYNLGSHAKIIQIIVNKIATITKIENKELQSPMTLGTDNANTFRRGIEWGSIVVEADSASTVFEVYAS